MGERLCFVAQYDDRRPNRLWFSMVADDPYHGFPSGESEGHLWPCDLWSHDRLAWDHRTACAYSAFGARNQAGGAGDWMRLFAKGCDPDGSQPFFLAMGEIKLAFGLQLDYILSNIKRNPKDRAVCIHRSPGEYNARCLEEGCSVGFF